MALPILQVPEYGKHQLIIGSTGSGKSYLAEKELNTVSNYFAIDTQDSLNIEGKILRSPERLEWHLRWNEKIRYIPKPEYINKDAFNYVFRTILEYSTKKKPHPRVTYIDEIYHVGYGISFPNWLPKAITTMRQRKNSIWTSTQRPRLLPLPLLTESSLIIVFYLTRHDDIKIVSQFARTDPKELMKALQAQQYDNSFIVIDNRKGTWEKYPKLKV